MTDRAIVEARRREADAILADDARRRGLEHEDWCNEAVGIGLRECDCGLGYPTPRGEVYFHPMRPSVFDGINSSYRWPDYRVP